MLTCITIRSISRSTTIHIRCGDVCATEAPLYYNDRHDFYALSRWDDVAREMPNWQTYRSGRGTIMDIIKIGPEIPPGVILFEDPPLHDLHRRLLSKVFTPRRMATIEPWPVSSVYRRSIHWWARWIRRHRRVGCTDPDAHYRLSARHPRTGSAADPRYHEQHHRPERGSVPGCRKSVRRS